MLLCHKMYENVLSFCHACLLVFVTCPTTASNASQRVGSGSKYNMFAGFVALPALPDDARLVDGLDEYVKEHLVHFL